jgi:ribosomal-protein-alanine N-acetyltransferase
MTAPGGAPAFPEEAGLPAGMRMRRAGEEDSLALAELELRLFPDDAWTVDMVHEELMHPSRSFVIVEQREGEERWEIVGYAGVMLLGDSADLHTIGTTLPGRGIGRALLDWSLRTTREGGARALVLEVREDNARARSVYEAAGFQDIGARPGYYPGPRGPVDARVMLREVDPA